MNLRMPTYYLSHAAGPWPYMVGPIRKQLRLLEQSLRDIPRQLPQLPKAVLVVSAHWEEDEFTVSSSPQPPMVYDYYGLPEELYYITYPAPGSPVIADRVVDLLTSAGWPARSDTWRGFDHGTFSLLAPMYPTADVPVVQLSMKKTLDPVEHLLAGQALARLREEGVLIVGSGQSYHNAGHCQRGDAQPAALFDTWLRCTLLASSPQARRDALADWEQAPAARVAHPREDHLIPLMVAAGAAGKDPATCIYGEVLRGAAASSFRFGADRTPSGFDHLAAPAAAHA
ncbi:MAG TPA: class III extradiol ring-cleavage dioxygenase [Burkholderiales bacterium]|nr:class III extradiol ring-cleavage dioxygenase [Burkholderiales bacterium]